MTCTIVTSYYPNTYKYSDSRFVEWCEIFLKLSQPIVLFTENSMIDSIKNIRGNLPIYIIDIPFEEIDTWILYKDEWIANHRLDPESHQQAPELLAFFAQKPFFVERAITHNPFNTDYFTWCNFDIVCDINALKILDTMISMKYLHQNKITIHSNNDFKKTDIKKKSEEICEDIKPYDSNEIRFNSTIWSGGINGCIKWKQLYVEMLEKYFKTNRFAGRDHQIIGSIYLENPSSVSIIWCSSSTSDITHEIQYNDNRPIVSANMLGGLGNQLFQIAAAYAYARKHNGKLQFLREKQQNDGRTIYWDSILRNCNCYLVDKLPKNLSKWNERYELKYTEICDLPQNGIIIGYYLQTSKYYYTNAIKNEIKSLFRSNYLMIQPVYEKYKNLFDQRDRVVVVHARRTDYLKNQHNIDFHGPLKIEYYNKAIKIMADIIINPIFLLVSDDPSYWTDNQFILDCYAENVYILDNETDVNTFTLIQQFDYLIIANSTFSWWGAWLAKSPKKIIAPAKWFGPNGPTDYNDIYEDEWERI